MCRNIGYLVLRANVIVQWCCNYPSQMTLQLEYHLSISFTQSVEVESSKHVDTLIRKEMITFNPTHIEQLRSQFYQLRDVITNCELTDNHHTKAKWLTMCAQALSFDDWGTLNNLSKSFSANAPSLVFTPKSITPIASKLRNAMGDPNLVLDHLKQAIISVGTSEEKALFGVSQNFKLVPPTEYILEFGVDPLYQFPLLKWFWIHRHMDAPEKEVLGYYLGDIKRVRKGLSRTEIKEKHLDVYAKQGHKLSELVDSLIDLGFVELFEGRRGRSLRITQRGAAHFLREITGEHNEAWSCWWTKFQSLFKNIPYKPITENWDRYISCFCRGETPEEAAQSCAWDDIYTDAAKLTEKAITQQTNLTEVPLFPSFKAFHFLPKLMLSQDIQNTRSNDINFTFDGPHWCASPEFKLKKLWPNKRYVGVESMGNRGWVSIIPDGITEFSVKYLWSSKSGKFRDVEHQMTYTLKPDPTTEENWLYGVNIGDDKNYRNNLFDYEHSFTSLMSLTHGQSLSNEEIQKLDRVKAGIGYLEITKEKVLIKERRTLIASNQFEAINAFD